MGPFCGIGQPMAPNETVSDSCHDTQLSLVDFGKMSEISYALNQNEASQNLSAAFPGWNLVYKTEPGSQINFMHVKRVRGRTHIIAVRGTHTVHDMIRDLELWMPSVFLQVVGIIGPPIGYQRNLLKIITKLASLQLFGGSQDVNPRDFTSLLKYVRNQTSQIDLQEKQLYITGHSLGGGFAAIVGALEGVTAVTFSAPGLEASSAMLSPMPELPALRFRWINVVPDHDLVPQVDSQSGSVLKINCAANSPIACHSLQSTLCELAAQCGEGGGRPQARDYTFACPTCAESVGSKSRNVPSWCTARDDRSVAPVLRLIA